MFSPTHVCSNSDIYFFDVKHDKVITSFCSRINFNMAAYFSYYRCNFMIVFCPMKSTNYFCFSSPLIFFKNIYDEENEHLMLKMKF